MPPAFTDGERERIARLLRESAYRLFTTQGVRKTSLDELVQAAGIAKSSFYRFFDSKEELFIELMLEQVPELQERLVGALEDESLDTGGRIREYLRTALDIQRHNVLYRRLLTHRDELETISRKLAPEQLERAKQLVIQPALDFFERARKEGRLVDVEPGIVLGVVQAVLTVPLQEEMLDPATYEPALELLIDIVASGLART